MTKPILGYIDCPHKCGSQMGVKHDKNGEPFGHCEKCRGQLRNGGDPERVRNFVAAYPWAARPPLGAADPVTVTVTDKPAAPAPITAQEPEQAPPRRRATFADALGVLGVRNAA